MKRGQYVAKSALCPFYKREDQQMIVCDGVEPNSTTHLAFSNASECRAYKQKHCRNEYTECEVYRMLEVVYEAYEL